MTHRDDALALNTAEQADERWDNQWSNYLSKPYRDQIFKQFLETLPAGARVLDVAGGPSRLSLVARELGYRPTCLDYSLYVVARLRQNGYSAIVFDIHEWDGEQFGDFDGAVCTECLEHLREPEMALKLIVGHCNTAVFTVPNLHGEQDKHETHANTWAPDELQEMLECYWRVVEIEPTDRYIRATVSERKEP